MAQAKSAQAAMLPSRVPIPILATVFEVVTAGKVYRVTGAVLQRWIARWREELRGRKGLLFRERLE